MFDSARFDLLPYAGVDWARYVRRTFCSWERSGWRSLLVQRFEHVPVAEDLALPGTADLHLVLPLSGTGGRRAGAEPPAAAAPAPRVRRPAVVSAGTGGCGPGPRRRGKTPACAPPSPSCANGWPNP